MILYAGALIDGGTEARVRASRPDPVRAVSIVEETRRAVQAAFPQMSAEHVETLVLRALYGHMTPGQA